MNDYSKLKARMHGVKPNKAGQSFWSSSLEFEDSILLARIMPEDAFVFLCDIFSDRDLSRKRGLDKFISVLFTDFDKMSKAQARIFLDVLVKHHSIYADKLTRHAIADFIARKYSVDECIGAFDKIIESRSAYSKHICFVGFDVLRARQDLPEAVRKMAVDRREQIEAR